MSRVIIAVAWVWLFAAAACGGESGPSPTGSNQTCTSDAECPEGEVCQSGACAPSAEGGSGDESDASGSVSASDAEVDVSATPTEGDSASSEDASVASDSAAVGDGSAGEDTQAPQDTTEEEDAGGPDASPVDEAPSVSISTPQEGEAFAYGEGVDFTGAVSDDLDAPETLSATWSSDLQGELGTSEVDSEGATTLSVEDLLPGTHVVSVSVSDSAGQSGTDSVSFLVNTAPDAPEISISPAAPTTLDALTVSVDTPAIDPDRDSSELTYTIEWLKNGESVEGLDSESVSAELTSRGELWVAVVTPFDGLNAGSPATAEVTIVNSAPSCAEAELTPQQGDTTTVFTCACPERDDPDQDLAVDTCTFTSLDGGLDAMVDAVDGVCQLDPAMTQKSMVISCAYTAGDGELEAEPVASLESEVLNASPLAPTVAIDPMEGTVKTAFTCLITEFSEDPDEDVVNYTTQWYVNGYPSDGDQSSSVVAESLVSDAEGTPARGGDSVRCEVIADDGEASSATAVSAEVVLGNSAPTGGEVQVTPGEADESTTLTCQVIGGEDADGDEITWTIVWFVDDVETPSSEEGTLSGSAFSKGDPVRCTATPSDGALSGELVESSNTVIIANTPPPAPVVTLSPASAGVGNTLTCEVSPGGEDIDGDEVSFEISWVVGGYVNPPTSLFTVSAGALQRDADGGLATGGDSVWCQARAHDGEAHSEAVSSETLVLDNSVPTGGSVVVTPGEATTMDALTCEASGAVDADGDDITWSYAWFVDDQVVAQESGPILSSDAFIKGQEVTCAASPSDGEGTGDAVIASNVVLIANSAPSAPQLQVSPPSGAVTQFYTCSLLAESEDVDGDEVSYSVVWLVNGHENSGMLDVPVAASELVSDFEGTLAAGGDALACRVVATDGADSSEPVQSPNIVFGNASPVGGAVTITPTEAYEGTDLSCEASGAEDPDGDQVFWLYSWSKDGEPIAGVAAQVLTGNHFDKGDEIRCTATPTDGQSEGSALESDLSVTILNSAPSTPLVP